jgi:hypothetical protein
MSTSKNNRRRFIKSVLAAGATIGVGAPLLHQLQSQDTSQVTMMTPDGKLVLVNRSVLDQNATVKKASEKEVFDWMNKEHKK